LLFLWWKVRKVARTFEPKVACWICDAADANTHDHMLKASSLRAGFPNVSQKEKRPIHFRRGLEKAKAFSAKSDHFKFNVPICAECNGVLTQPHDEAWSLLVKAFFGPLSGLKPGDHLDVRSVYGREVVSEMRNVHLYLLKLLGCHIIDAKTPLSVSGIARSILRGTANAEVYVKFGITGPYKGSDFFGGAPFQGATSGIDGSCVWAGWIHYEGKLAAHVVIVPTKHTQAVFSRWTGLSGYWHPRQGVDAIRLGDFRFDEFGIAA
jgi:hypothetical protein